MIYNTIPFCFAEFTESAAENHCDAAVFRFITFQGKGLCRDPVFLEAALCYSRLTVFT